MTMITKPQRTAGWVRRSVAAAAVPLLALTLASCQTAPSRQSGDGTASSQAPSTKPASSSRSESASMDLLGNEPDALDPMEKTEKYPGTGRFVSRALASQDRPEPAEEGEISFNFEGLPLQEVVKTILGDILNENYVIAPGVAGQVTFATARPVTEDQILPILEMLLSWNNAAMVYVDGRYQVMPRAQAIPGHLTPRMDGLSLQKGYEVRAIPLRFISPIEMEKLLKPYAREGSIINVDNARGLLTVAGTPRELQNYMDTIRTFDVDWLAGMSVGIFRLERVEVATVVTELEAVFGEGSGTPLAGMFRFLPLERLNAVMVITPQPRYLDEAEAWVARLDRGGAESGVRLYVYDVKHVKAVDLADTLNEVFGGSGRSSNRSSRGGAGEVAPGLQRAEISNVNNRRQNNQAQNQRGNSSARSGGVALVGGEEIRITAVEESNALLVRATPGQYDSISQAIKRLDAVPLQVHVEVQVLEVSLNDSLQYGVRFFLDELARSGAFNNFFQGSDNVFPDDDSGATQPFRPRRDGGRINGDNGLQYAYSGSNSNFGAILDLLQTTTNIRTVSAPSLLVLNNREANINVGTQIPVVTTRFNNNLGGGDGNTIGSVQFRDTGVTLDVTPRVNPGGMVFLEIAQEVSNPTGQADATGNVSVNRRQIDTEIAVMSGETVLLGGLIQDNQETSRNGVPILKDIPGVGALFGSQGVSGLRTELLVLITPTVATNVEEARDITEEYEKRFKGIEPIKAAVRAPTETASN